MPWKVINGEPKFFIETNVKQTKKWRTETNKEFYERFGHWYWFTGYPKRVRKTWIEQYDRSANEDSTK
jgi:hypothetical protein|tara:strand:+ start:624 stop:827 length:204 start_codon:yes stop_codon:yes gene_type:complete